MTALGFGGDGYHNIVKYDDYPQLVRHAITNGITTFDTSTYYNNQSALGEVLKSVASVSEIDIIVKVGINGINRDPDSVTKDYTKAGVIKSIEVALKTLKVDTVKYALLHDPYQSLEVDTGLEGLRYIKRQGKAKHIGISTLLPSLHAYAIRQGADCLMIYEHYNALKQEPSDLFKNASAEGVITMNAAVLAFGELTKPDAHPELAKKAEAEGLTLPQYAIDYVLKNPLIDINIVGLLNKAEVDAATAVLSKYV